MAPNQEPPTLDYFDIQENSLNQFVDFVDHFATNFNNAEDIIPIDPYEEVQIPYLPNLREILRSATGSENLEEVTELQLKVISHEVGLNHISTYIPRLRELNLEGSILSSIRDLGCSFQTLKVLNVARCGLTSLDGVSGIESLEEIYAARNYITELTACALLENVKVINVKRNRIFDLANLSFLSMCNKLEELTLEGNPRICNLPTYRKSMKLIIPKLKILDSIEYSEEECLNFLDHNSDKKDEKTKQEALPPMNSARNTETRGGQGAYCVSFGPRVLSPRSDEQSSQTSELPNSSK